MKKTILASEALFSCRAAVDRCWTSHLGWITSHVDAGGDQIMNKLEASERGHDSPTIPGRCFEEARPPFRHFSRLCPSDVRVSSGNSLLPVPNIFRADAHPLYRLRICSAFTGSKLRQVGRKQDGSARTFNTCNTSVTAPDVRKLYHQAFQVSCLRCPELYRV